MRPLMTGVCSVLVAVGAMGAATAADTRITAGGATFPKAIYLRWADDFGKAMAGTQLEYNAQGSGFGINGITNKTLDLAGSDAPMSKKEIAAVTDGEIVHIPTVAGAVVIAYNIPGFEGDLKLTGEIIADVYLGTITKWNDSKITAINPGAKLPDLGITPIYRSDGSGTTFVFSNYLATQSTDFIKQTPPGKTMNLKVGTAAKGSEGVSQEVKRIAGGLGYVELTYAFNEKIAFASLKNKAGNFVKATPESVSKAGASAEKLTAAIWNSPDAEAYPIASFTYLLTYKDLGHMDEAKAKAIVAFLKYTIGEGQAAAPSLYFAPLPDAMKAKAAEAIKGLTYKGKPIE